jgi:hypothetical protein
VQFSAAPLNQLQTIGLKWAALSRTILAGGTCVVLKEQVDNGHLRGSHAKSLGAIISICALAGECYQSTTRTSIQTKCCAYKNVPFIIDN